MGGKSKRAYDFEFKIRDFLNKMKLSDVNGGSNFIINGTQVDACGGHENTLFVIEATTQRKSLRNKIKEFRGVIDTLNQGFKKDNTYKYYTGFKYIIASSQKNVSKNDKKFANKKPYIHIWDKKFIDYYLELHEIIKKYAKYNLLGDMGIKPQIEDYIIVPAFKTKVNNYTLYNFYLDARSLLKTAYVARREIGREKYYQRMVKKK